MGPCIAVLAAGGIHPDRMTSPHPPAFDACGARRGRSGDDWDRRLARRPLRSMRPAARRHATKHPTKGDTVMSTSTTTINPGGPAVLRDPIRNRGTAFTLEQQAELGITGLLPLGVQTLEEQAARAYAQFLAQPTPLAQNTFMEALRDRNETLYYKLLADH